MARARRRWPRSASRILVCIYEHMHIFSMAEVHVHVHQLQAGMLLHGVDLRAMEFCMDVCMDSVPLHGMDHV